MFQGVHRHLSTDTILLDLDDYLETIEDFNELSAKKKQEYKKSILSVFIKLMDRSGKIVNTSKCLTDIFNRECKATTGLGEHIAIPHVRTLQAKEFLIGIMRSEKGVYFNSLDGEPVHVFIGILCPPYEDKLYLKFLSDISKTVKSGELFDLIMQAENEKDILGQLCRLSL